MQSRIQSSQESRWRASYIGQNAQPTRSPGQEPCRGFFSRALPSDIAKLPELLVSRSMVSTYGRPEVWSTNSTNSSHAWSHPCRCICSVRQPISPPGQSSCTRAKKDNGGLSEPPLLSRPFNAAGGRVSEGSHSHIRAECLAGPVCAENSIRLDARQRLGLPTDDRVTPTDPPPRGLAF